MARRTDSRPWNQGEPVAVGTEPKRRGNSLKIWPLVLASALASNALAKPIEVDLAPERAAYEAKARPRNIGLTLLGASLGGYMAGAIGAWYASSARTQLLLQQLPIDLQQRRELIAGGTAATTVTGLTIGLGAILTAISIYFLVVSF